MKNTYILQKFKWTSSITIQKISAESVRVFLLSLVAFSLAFDYRFTTFSLILLGASILYLTLKQKVKINKVRWYTILPWIAFYVWFAVGYFYSEDQHNSYKDLETKFSLLALPLLIGLFTTIPKNRFSFVFSSFIVGLLCMEISCLFYALGNYVQNGQVKAFLYHQLVSISDINAAYFSWYILFSLVLLSLGKLPFKPLILFIVSTFQIVFLILLSSRTSQAVFIFIIVPIIFYHYRRFYRNKFYKFIAILYLLMIGFSLWNPSLFNKRVNNISINQAEQAFLPQYHHHSYEFSDIGTRLFFWRVGVENFLSNNSFLGVGNGDVNHVQNERMHELGILNIYNEEQPSNFLNMNLHNMYLQSLLAAGLVGFILLLCILFLPIFLAIRSKNMLLLLFQLISILFMAHESALQTQAGVVFYSFFSLLLINYTQLGASSSAFKTPERSIQHLAKVKLAKRTFDIVIAIIVLIPFTILLLPICALFIKLSSAGPVFFRQQRTGLEHRPFYCYKLRTMKVNDRADTHQAIENDPRITKIGYFLRVMHIDEIPQMYNVLKGDMSIIGPRPHMLYHTKVYSECISYYDQRLKTKPGLTGLAQIKGYVGEIKHPLELKKRVLNDIYYVKKSSWKLNFFILFMTIKNILEKLLVFKKNRKTV